MEILHIEDKDIGRLRKIIKNDLLRLIDKEHINGVQVITVPFIERLIDLYDSYVLDGFLKRNLREDIKVSLSRRMTSAGGKTIYYPKRVENKFEIRISLVILQEYIQSGYSGKICGIKGEDIIDGLMFIMEHELCHVLEFLLYGVSSCKSRRFKTMAWKLFRHGASTHEVIAKNTSAVATSGGNTIKIGQRVTFNYKEKKYYGVVTNINKRATVMVEDEKGQYKDKNGIKFNKWYVPLIMLQN